MATKTSSCSSSLSLFSSPLTIDQLIDVLDLLERCGFPQTRWKELGLRLGLHKKTLDAIKRDNDTTDDYLTECLSNGCPELIMLTVKEELPLTHCQMLLNL
uniref:Death domain-containing protein n=1 Tax=Amphimedon queenslandica TaxID=400682 RepID=A0A1X7TCW5_AMPQE